ncbi:MAG: efflux RND transporter periplasmic adaptor subunit, partial [Planctomycetales bacterium]|nr:efflux RND transporter periplasmic adaptor subunit [Planctomycetales bacterium]
GPDQHALLSSTVEQLAPCATILRQLRPGPFRRWWNSAFASERHGRNLTAGLIAAIFLSLLILPVPYRVKCSCAIEPLTRRFIPVPYDGVLKDVHVEPGDVVVKDQLLARMDDREILWELAAKQADYQRAKKQQDAALALANTAEAQLAQLEMERLSVQIELLRNRIEHLEIKSPIDGVVISGDPAKRQGARLTQGETLFETGPLERMLVELYIPDAEIAHVQDGQKVHVRLDAFPTKKLTGSIARISPSSEPFHQANVFVGEVEFDNPQHLLRPGMSGESKVITRRHSLGWILFHKAWYALAR